MYTNNSYQQKMHANTRLATEEAGTMCTDLFVLYLLYDHTNLWMTSPERSLGSNQVVLGGHDVAGVGNVHELLHRYGIEGEGHLHLTAITIFDNSKLTSIGDAAFAGCSSLTNINIPEGVTSIGIGAFWDCI